MSSLVHPLSRTVGGMPLELLSMGIKGKVPRLYISPCFLIAVRDAQRTTYSRKIVNLTLWDTESAMENELSLAYNNTSGIVLKLGNCLAWSSGES